MKHIVSSKKKNEVSLRAVVKQDTKPVLDDPAPTRRRNAGDLGTKTKSELLNETEMNPEIK